MKFILLIYNSETKEAKTKKADLHKIFGAYMAYSQALRDANAYIDGEPLQRVNTARSVSVRNGNASKRAGAAHKTKEELGGYYKIEAASMADALKWAAKCPGSWTGTVEVRPIMKMG